MKRLLIFLLFVLVACTPATFAFPSIDVTYTFYNQGTCDKTIYVNGYVNGVLTSIAYASILVPAGKTVTSIVGCSGTQIGVGSEGLAFITYNPSYLFQDIGAGYGSGATLNLTAGQ